MRNTKPLLDIDSPGTPRPGVEATTYPLEFVLDSLSVSSGATTINVQPRLSFPSLWLTTPCTARKSHYRHNVPARRVKVQILRRL